MKFSRYAISFGVLLTIGSAMQNGAGSRLKALTLNPLGEEVGNEENSSTLYSLDNELGNEGKASFIIGLAGIVGMTNSNHKIILEWKPSSIQIKMWEKGSTLLYEFREDSTVKANDSNVKLMMGDNKQLKLTWDPTGFQNTYQNAGFIIFLKKVVEKCFGNSCVALQHFSAGCLEVQAERAVEDWPESQQPHMIDTNWISKLGQDTASGDLTVRLKVGWRDRIEKRTFRVKVVNGEITIIRTGKNKQKRYTLTEGSRLDCKQYDHSIDLTNLRDPKETKKTQLRFHWNIGKHYKRGRTDTYSGLKKLLDHLKELYAAKYGDGEMFYKTSYQQDLKGDYQKYLRKYNLAEDL